MMPLLLCSACWKNCPDPDAVRLGEYNLVDPNPGGPDAIRQGKMTTDGSTVTIEYMAQDGVRWRVVYDVVGED